MTHIVAGDSSPRFSLKTLDGREFSLASQIKNGPVVLAFFKVSCPVCQFTFPFLERLYEQYAGEGVSFWGISQDDARASAKFAAEYGVTFPILLDAKDYPVSNAYGLTNVPTIFLIDSDGSVEVAFTGFDKSGLESIAKQLAERRKIPLAALFRPNESVPAHKPG